MKRSNVFYPNVVVEDVKSELNEKLLECEVGDLCFKSLKRREKFKTLISQLSLS